MFKYDYNNTQPHRTAWQDQSSSINFFEYFFMIFILNYLILFY